MKIQAYTEEDLFALGKAIINTVTGMQYPFSERRFHTALIKAMAMFGANASMETIRTIKGGSLEGLKGQLLDRRALDNRTVRFPTAAARGSGRFIPTNPGAAGSPITIDPNTVVIKEATATQKEVAFKTEAMATIGTTGGLIDASSNLLFLTCTEAGEKGNNIPLGTQLKLRSTKSGVSHFLLNTATGGGSEREQDPGVRVRARAARRGHGENTWAGIESLLTSVALSTGQRCTAAKLFEAFDEPAPYYSGIVYAIIDDGSGDDDLVAPTDTTTYGPYDNFIANPYWTYQATKSTVYIPLPQPHIVAWSDGVNAGLRKNGAGPNLVEGTDFWVDSDRGVIALNVALAAGEYIWAQFGFYTGLVREAAYNVNGIPKSDNVRGWRPVGYSIRIRGPYTLTKPSVAATLHFKSGFDSTYGRAVGAALVLTYLQGLPIGEPARYNVISGILHRVPGVEYVDAYTLDGGTSDVAPTHKFGVIRGDITTIAT